MIYLDNSASTMTKPKEVLRSVNESLINYSANPGRSGHKASIRTALMIERTREYLSEIYNNGSGEKVIFTHNCTQALNLAILGCAKKGGHIICTENEHNSVLRPLEHLKNRSIIDYDIAFQNDKGGIKLNDITPLVKENTYMIICNHISNVNGDKADIENIGRFCKQKNILFLVDCAQSCGHIHVDMQQCGINFIAIAGHKGFFSPQGVGALIICGETIPQPIVFGGTGTNSLELVQPLTCPERLESGTIATPAILGLKAGIEFVECNFKDIQLKLDDLTTYLNYELHKLPINIYTQPENAFGVFAFNIPSLHSNEVATLLDEQFNICVRGGFHCAPIKHKALNTLEEGAVRISISYFNTFTEIQRVINSIKSIEKRKKILAKN